MSFFYLHGFNAFLDDEVCKATLKGYENWETFSDEKKEEYNTNPQSAETEAHMSGKERYIQDLALKAQTSALDMWAKMDKKTKIYWINKEDGDEVVPCSVKGCKREFSSKSRLKCHLVMEHGEKRKSSMGEQMTQSQTQ